jgi:hypothetical protein
LSYNVHAQQHVEEAIIPNINALDLCANSKRRGWRFGIVRFRPNANVEQICPMKLGALYVPDLNAAFALEAQLLNEALGYASPLRASVHQRSAFVIGEI